VYVKPFNAAFNAAIVPVAVMLVLDALLETEIKLAILPNANLPSFTVKVIVSTVEAVPVIAKLPLNVNVLFSVTYWVAVGTTLIGAWLITCDTFTLILLIE